MVEMKIEFQQSDQLGSGGYGSVFKGEFQNDGVCHIVAVKKVSLEKVNTKEEEALRELQDHQNIVRLFHCESDDHFRKEIFFCMYYAMELCDASLDQLFLKSHDPQKYNGPIPSNMEVFSQLADGLEYIHSKKFIHRDIKPGNILIKRPSPPDEKTIIKWADFGLSKDVNERGTRTMSKIVGTYTCDVFVLGLVIGYLFLNGKHLYGYAETEIHINIKDKRPIKIRDIKDELCDCNAYNILSRMLEDDPSKRITSKQVVKQLNSRETKHVYDPNNHLDHFLLDPNRIAREEEFRRLCALDTSSDLIVKLQQFIKDGIDVNAKNRFGKNALHILCEDNLSSELSETIKFLIQRGIDVNAKGNHKLNALHYLCRNKENKSFIGAMETLIEQGIDINATNKYGENALHFLCGNYSTSNSKEAIRILIEKGIRVIPNGNDLRSILRKNNELSNIEKKEILKLLDKAALAQG
ncbi:hypothetical protein GHT06_014611 [Daphnia sinensis]|uniref:Protein kinase domain-containing protein n=1 Tax=Daphnia sinensis TaxID=1820382 RepID=A0AAD5L817_9CRUS|nr:hypothetical protein GHT06_014611 [Daphnia sinensis]